jgi:hypothetical protein
VKDKVLIAIAVLLAMLVYLATVFVGDFNIWPNNEQSREPSKELTVPSRD